MRANKSKREQLRELADTRPRGAREPLWDWKPASNDLSLEFGEQWAKRQDVFLTVWPTEFLYMWCISRRGVTSGWVRISGIAATLPAAKRAAQKAAAAMGRS